ncbi:unnamed protein product [Urochloa humidicola]
MESSSHKRAREAAAADFAGTLPEAADAKRLRPEDLLDLLDDDTDAAAAGDLASVMRSLEEEIASFDEATAAVPAAQHQPQPELGFLLEASDDELGLPPAGASSSSEDAGAAAEDADVAASLDGQIWGFEDEIDGGFGGYSPEAAAARAAAAAWDDYGFDAGLFAFGDDACGPSDLAALRHETMPAV